MSYREAAPSPRQRGLLIGAIVGGLAAGILGNRVCHAYSATPGDSCIGDAFWWAVAGGMLGGLIGASAEAESDS